jgi:hypothetical protein
MHARAHLHTHSPKQPQTNPKKPNNKNRNPDFASAISPNYLRNATHCPSTGPHGRRLLRHESDAPVAPSYFLSTAGVSTGASVVGGVALAVLSLHLFKRAPAAYVRASVAATVAIPASIAVVALLSGAPGAGVPFALIAGLLGFTLYLYREQLSLVARLLGISLHAISDQPGILVAALGLQALGVVILAPLALAALLAAANGHVVPNPMRATIGDDGRCFAASAAAGGASGDRDATTEVLCCTWQVDGWVPGYLAYVGLVGSWSVLLVFSVKFYTVAGATAQWYFAEAGYLPKGATLRSARHALGPSFGTLCLASWCLTLVKYARAALDKMRADNEGGFFGWLFATCLDFLYAIFEALTSFGIVRAAITGEAFFDACAAAASLLSRNLLDAVGVWWLPGMILSTASFMISAAWGMTTFGIAASYWGGGPAAVTSGAAIGVLSWLSAFLTLSFVNGVLLNVVDAVYVAWAMDKDAAAVTRSDVHAVFGAPGAPWAKPPGAVVEGPGGEYAFGAIRDA